MLIGDAKLLKKLQNGYLKKEKHMNKMLKHYFSSNSVKNK